MADRRRRSPESSNRRENHYYNEPPRTRYSAESLSSSSSSSSYLDISRTFPTRAGLRAFFTAPSERRRLRKRRSKGLLRLGNSSSSSVNSDLAYGTGFIKKPKRRGVRSRKGKEIDRESHRGYARDGYKDYAKESTSYTQETNRDIREQDRERPGNERRSTDAEILAVGAGLAKLARDQNKRDLKAGKIYRGAEAFVEEPSSYRNSGTSKGLGPSKASHGKDSSDDDGWESASDGESESSVDSKLAFGEDTGGGWFSWGKERQKPQIRKSTIVDPRLFGRQNSLNGIITEPVGYGATTWTPSNNFGQNGQGPVRPENYANSQVSYFDQRTIPSTAPQQNVAGSSYTPYYTQQTPTQAVPPDSSTSSSRLPPMQQVYPVPTEDPSRFEVARGSVASGAEPYVSSRPVAIQQPQPITPVSQSVYEPTYSARADGGILKRTPSSSGRGQSLAEAAIMGVAGAAIGTAIISDRKDDRKDDRKEKRRDDRDTSSRISSRSYDKEDRRHERRREKEKSKDSDDEKRRDKKREKRRDDGREETKEERRERRREERRSERSDVTYESRRPKSEASVFSAPVDPFQYQVADDAFSTPVIPSTPNNGRITAAPTVVTVDREPDFSRDTGSSNKDRHVVLKSQPLRDDEWDSREQRYRQKDSDEKALHNAEDTYRETQHSTAPIEAAAIGAAIAAVVAEDRRESRSDRRRDERRNGRRDYDDYDQGSSKKSDKSTDRDREHDKIQEEADRAYREIIMARKIASQVIRSRSPSPDPSVVNKYDHQQEEEEIIRIITPPGMEDHKKKGPYDAPNADFQLDYVLEHPRDLQTFSVPSTSREAPYLKRDPDAILPRPHLNLVRPTPVPTPVPEKQAAREEKKPARSDSDKPSKPNGQEKRVATSEIAIDSKGNVVAVSSPPTSTPTSSTVSKGVTWGQNETKHYVVESPTEHRDEFVSSSDIRTREQPVDAAVETRKASERPSSGWGAVAAAVTGASFGAAIANSSDTSKKSKSKEGKKAQQESGSDTPYEYRGIVVEPESPSRSKGQSSPPPPGPKPSSPTPSHIPGAFDDEFAATVAAGLQDSGFDPNIVIDDPSFRRRQSPPGSDFGKLYRAPFAETVSDLGTIPLNPASSDASGFVIEEVPETPKDWESISVDNGKTTKEPKLSKKEQRKREKAARTQSDDIFATPLEEPSSHIVEESKEPESYFETPKLSKKEQKKRDKAAQRASQFEDETPLSEPTVAQELVEEPESYFETPKKSKKKSKKSSSTFDYETEETPLEKEKISVPVDAFADIANGEDEWAETKKSKKKSKRDSDRFDSPNQSVVSEFTPGKKSKRDSGRFDSPARSVVSEPGPELERSSSKKSKDKSRRRSEHFEPEVDPAEVSLPPITPSEIYQDVEFDDSRKSRKSSRKDSGDRDESRSVVSESATKYFDDDYKKSKKKSRSSTRDDFDDTRSVASAPAGDDFDDKKSKKKDKRLSGGLWSLFGSKSESGAREETPKASKDDFEDVKRKKKSKRNSMPDGLDLYGVEGSQSVGDLSRISSNGNGNHYEDDDDGGGGDKGKSRSRAESASSKKDSFLANAGTLGAGVGLTGAAVAIAQHHQRSNASIVDSKESSKGITSDDSLPPAQHYDIIDPEITQREIRPSIDPQYGDLLPLPPSDPASPDPEPVDGLPELPESRPDTPEADRVARERVISSVRKNIQEAPVKSPSQSAVPLKFFMGNRSNPASPSLVRASPSQSPATPTQESLGFPRFAKARPKSWDSTKEFKPLYLVESNRRSSVIQANEEEVFPSLPPSQSTSRSSSELGVDDNPTERYGLPEIDLQKEGIDDSLAIDTSEPYDDMYGSQQSTPKAKVLCDNKLPIIPNQEAISESHYATPASRPASPQLPGLKPEHADIVAEVLGGAALASTIGYFASSPTRQTTKQAWLEDLPSASTIPRQPSPIEPMSKDRSSYLLQSSPLPSKFEEHDYDLESPLAHKVSNFSEDVGLRDIEERDGNDVFDEALGRDDHGLSRGVADTQELPDTNTELAESQPIDTLDLVDEFSLAKTKKDKKNDKKKAKGLSRSVTLDDISSVQGDSIIESIQDDILPAPTQEGALADETGPVEEFSTKSKKDKKKDKKKGKGLSSTSTSEDVSSFAESTQIPGDHVAASVIGEDEPLSRSIGEDYLTTIKEQSFPKEAELPDIDQTLEEFAVTKPKKDKKKEKKKAKGLLRTSTTDDISLSGPVPAVSEDVLQAAEPELTENIPHSKAEETAVPETSNDETRAIGIPGNIDPVDEFSLRKSKKEKKKDKKKNKSAMSWEPEPEEPTTDLLLTSGDIIDTQTAEPVDAPGDFSFTQSKKDQKKNKKGGAEIVQPPIFEDTIVQPIEQTTAEDIVRDTLEDIQPSVEADLAEDFSFAKSKKDKKKDKKKGGLSSSWDPPEDEAIAASLEPPRDLQNLIKDSSITKEPWEQETQGKKRKKDKKEKSIAASSFEDSNAKSSTDYGQDLSQETINSIQSTVPAETPVDVTGAKDVKQINLPAETQGSVGEDSIFDTLLTKRENSSTSLPTWAAEGEINTDETLAVIPAVTAPVEEWDTPLTKKSKKKKKSKADVPWETEDQTLPPDTTQLMVDESEAEKARPKLTKVGDPTPIRDIASERLSESSGAVEGVQTPAFESAVETPTEIEAAAPYLASTKSKKKLKKLQKWDSSLTAEEIQDTLSGRDEPKPSGSQTLGEDNFLVDPKATPPNDASTPEYAQAPISTQNVPIPLEPSTSAPESLLATPATPWATSLEEQPLDPSNAEYFPSAAGLHSAVDQVPKDLSTTSTPTRGYFPSAATLLSFVGMGKKSEPEQVVTPSSPSQSQQVHETQEPLDSRAPISEAPAPDGLKAGYDNDQLSLARQLQQEFGKKSKKDKKKRQSLPSTPDSEIPRSRARELADTHLRSRSLSVDPSPALESLRDDNSNEQRKNVYSEDQLELARQLKAEFEGGNKKSKKDKKKRQSIVPEIPWDEPLADQPTDSVVEAVTADDAHRANDIEDSAKRDGFEAGYQEDQLSLARQLQAEFASGSSKKSKKDKNRRSTSQTPIQETESQNDFFGTPDEPATIEPLSEEVTNVAGLPAEEKPFVHDGFAAGYKEDQLELARQLKEEFGSGSKKSKKDKKRQSLSRGISSSGHASPLEPVTLDGAESGVQTPDTAPNDLVAEPEDEFPTVVKKSKKDKKGKKRQSLAWEDAADTPPEATTPDSGDKEIIDISTADRQVVEEDPIPEEEFSMKKSKKEKKAKKRQNLPHADTDEIVAAGMAVEGSEILHKLDNMNSSVEHSRSDHDVDHAISAEAAGDQSEQVQEVPKSLTDNTESSKEEVKSDALDAEPIPDIIDELAMPSKKSKKDKKKKRDSSVQPPTANPAPEQQLLEEPLVEEPLVEEPTTDMPNNSAQPSLPTLDGEKDQSEFTSKKSKKDKKKKKAVEMSLSEEAPQLSEPTEGAASTTAPFEAESPSTPAVEAQEDEFAFTTKKSKKDKKKQKIPESSPAEEEPQGSKSIEERLSQDTSLQAETPVTPAIDAQEDEFEFTTKKSKKDKKNRKNNQPIAEAATVLGSPSVKPSLEDVVNDISLPVADDNADVFEVTTKKSKKDKKKSKSPQSPSPKDETPATAEKSIESTFQDVIDETPNLAPTKPQDISFESTSKNSETGKENIREGIQLSVPETLSPQLDISLAAESQVKGPETTLDNAYIPDLAPQQDAPIVLPANESVGASEEVFADNVSLRKNSEKDQKGQEKSGFSGIDEESKQSMPPESISEPIIVHPSLTTGDVPEKPVDATEIATHVPDSLPAKDIPKADEEQPDEEWGNFSMKRSKKDKKKHKSGISTPVKPEIMEKPVSEDAKLSAEASPMPADTAKEALEQVEDEWGSPFAKKSKKGKKKANSGLSTPLESITPSDEPPQDELVADDTLAPGSSPEKSVQQSEEEWSSLPSKKSKKDKKKNKSGLSTQLETANSLEETSKEEPIAGEPSVTESIAEQPEDEWGSFSSKKSKKDKKKARSGISTPAEPSTLEQGTLRGSPMSDEAPAVEALEEIHIEQPEDQGSSFSSKSKKDKKKGRSGLSTPLEQEISITSPLIEEVHSEQPIIEKEAEQPEDDLAAPVSSKKSKKDKGKSKFGLSTPLEQEAEGKSLTELTPAMQLAPGQEIEQLEDDWAAPATSKKSKKDKKKGKNSDFKVSEESEDIVPDTAQIVEHAEAPADDPVSKEDNAEQPEDEWASFSTKKSKKDKKTRKSGNSTPLVVEAPHTSDDKPSEEPAQLIIEEPQPDESLSRQSEIPKPEDEWGTFSAKNSKKDKNNRKSGISTPVEETDPVSEQVANVEKEETTQPPPETALLQQNELQQPEDEWGTFPAKKSKKDQKNRKSGILTPAEERTDATEQVASVAEEEVNEPSIISSTGEALSQSPKLPQPQEEWAGKKSKKDKKNRKSGISTPLEESVPAAEKEEVVETSANPPPPVPEEGVREQIDSQQPDDEWGSFSVKKSKKDKKKSKSGTATPIEDCVAVNEAVSAEKEATTEPNTSPQPDEPVPSQDELQEPEDWGSFPVKKSKEKRDKKNRKSGPPTPIETDIVSIAPQATVKETAVPTIEDTSNQAVSNSQTAQELSEGARGMQETNDDFFPPTTKSSKKVKKNRKSGLSMPLEEATIVETKASNSREITTDPVTVSEAKQTIVSSVQVDEASDTQQPEIPSASHEEHEAYLETGAIVESPVELARSSSKKEKRKRQVTTDTVMSEEPSSSSIPALTSWADEVEEAEVERELPVIDEIANDESLSHIASTTATDDFTRPTKKGKKGKKKDSVQASSLRSPVTVTPKKDSGESSMKPAAVVAAAAALVGAAITASGSAENSSMSEEAAKPPISKKLSKKEKRKKSIDRRTPQDDDIFDDPVLWEGAKPTALQEIKGTEDGPENDGFWSPQRGEPAVDHEESPAQQNRDIQTEDPPDNETMSIDPSSNVVSTPQQSENAQITKEQSPPDTFHAKDISRDSDERILIAGPEQHHAELPELASYRSLGEREYYDPRDAPIAEALNQVTASLYRRPGSRAGSVLPVVREESPVQGEAEQTTRKLSPSPHSVDFNRDSAFITESPIPLQKGFTDQHEHIRDSGVHLRDFSPADKSREPVSTSDGALARMSWPAVDEESETVDLHKSQQQKTKSSMEPREFDSHASPRSNEKRLHSSLEKSPAVELRKSPLSKSRTISPQNNEARNSYKLERHSHDPSSDLNLLPSQKLAAKDDKPVELHRTQTIHRSATPKGESLVQQRVKRIESPDIQRSQKPKEDKYKELSTPQRPPPAERPSSFNESSIAAGAILGGAALGFAAARQSSREQRPGSVGSSRSSPNINRLRTPDLRPESVISNRSTGTPPLRRSDRKSGDLRSLSQHSSPNLAKEAELAAITAAQVNVANPTANEGRVRAKDMADVYDGFGEGRMGSPRSPTRPHSMRRRQSMQVLDLESKLEQLAADNRVLTEAKAQAEHALQLTQHASSTLVERDAEIDALKRTLDWLRKEVTRLSEVNDGLTSANITLGNQHNDRYGQLEAQHTQATRELQELRATHENLSSGMEGIVRNEVQGLMEGKDQEIERLRAELDAAKEQIRTMQRQILASKPDNLAFLTIRDEDYFDTACQQLCQHVQQWVLRFSKFSDMRACRLTKEINNDKIIDRLDNAILDGSDVDNYLADRVKRRDVFMSMTMTMIWEYVFTRYLFGMDREQRQKLKSLEKILLEVGPASAVHQWRATTLTLLSKRRAFIEQREQDTLAVVNVVMETLTEILPPPSHLEEQIQEQLIRVMKAAVELSIEMRTQRAEYMMLPPLQPEYDANGDLASKVSFNAALMNERSGESVSNEALEEQGATVRIVLFPLVVKKGDDNGAGDEEIVVCPAQVLVARPKKTVRLFTPESLQNHSRVSMQSSMPADHGDNLI